MDNRYDEYGIPQATNVGRFQYTGQACASLTSLLLRCAFPCLSFTGSTGERRKRAVNGLINEGSTLGMAAISL